MLRTIYFYVAVCCGALALANLVGATPPGSKGPASPAVKVSPAPSVKITPTPKVTPIVAPKVIVKDVVKIDPKIVTPKIDKLPAGPTVKLPAGAKFDVGELSKIKPPIDLTKTSGAKLVTMKPPADFKVKPIDLGKIVVPADALKVAKLGAKVDLKGAKFVVNPDFFKGTDYHLKFGVKGPGGWIYHGHHHSHWHHCVWDPCCGCYYYYDPCVCCYYYYSDCDDCYYPCWWFVDYCGSYYPWWLCGGFESHGYHCHPHHRVAIRFGW